MVESIVSLDNLVRLEYILVVSGEIDPMAVWQVQEAKTHLSEVIEQAQKEGPQTITRHGAERAVLLSVEDFRRLMALRTDFRSYLLGGPKTDEFEIERDRDTGREVSL